MFAHHFVMGTGVSKDLLKLGDLSQVSQQVRDKARNATETFLGPRPNASGHHLRMLEHTKSPLLLLFQGSAECPFPPLSPSLHQLLSNRKLLGVDGEGRVPTPL